MLSVPVLEEVVALDASVVSTRGWNHRACPAAPNVLARVFARLAPWLWRLPALRRRAAHWRQGAPFRALVGEARRDRHQEIDTVLAFNLPALAAALVLKRSLGWPFHFDAEDDHVQLLPDEPAFAVERGLRDELIRLAVHEARSLTAASPLMSHELSSRYGRPFPTILNAFDPVPLPHEPQRGTRSGLRFAWHSQTIGPNRGLESMARILARIPHASLHLRGRMDPSFAPVLDQVVTDAGWPRDRVQILDLLEPDQLIPSLSDFDFGLATEPAIPGNRDHCLSNKIFELLAAGMPIVLSRTRAQTEFARELGDAALLIDLDDESGSASSIREWCTRADAIAHAARASRRLSVERFNWSIESMKLADILSLDCRRSECAS